MAVTRSLFRVFAAVALGALAFGSARPAAAGLWQYSAVVESADCKEIHDHPRAYLWIPPNCKRVRAVIVAQHNLLEESILLDPQFRATLQKLGMAEVWIVPNIDYVFDFSKGSGEKFDDALGTLAAESGYREIATAPVVPMGHSAAASYPWNFAAWTPNRTLAVLSIHGDMPESNLTGSGRPNPDWGSRTIDGIPGLFVMGQYEWLDKRTQPGLDYVAKHPMTPLAMLSDIGHGHFDTSPEQIAFLCLFLRKAAEYRLPKNAPPDGPVPLKPVDPRQGWLVDRWEPSEGRVPSARLEPAGGQSPSAGTEPQAERKYPAAPYNVYSGDRGNAFWCFDREMAEATENYGKGRVLDPKRKIVYVQDGKVLEPKSGAAGVMPRPQLETDADGRTCHFSAYAVHGDVEPGTEWNDAEAASVGAVPLTPKVLCGPLAYVGGDTYRLEFDQSGFNSAYRSFNTFLSTMISPSEKDMAQSQPGGVFVARNTAGADNAITFPQAADVGDTRKPIKLNATASSGLPVAYYVDSGPAVIDGDVLKFTPIPPRSRFPVAVRVIAWQWGRSSVPQVKSADPIVMTFRIVREEARHK